MKRLPVEERFEFYETPEECAFHAAPIFQQNRWRWSTGMGGMGKIPDIGEIVQMLHRLRDSAAGERKCESGRLIFHPTLGYGHFSDWKKRRVRPG